MGGAGVALGRRNLGGRHRVEARLGWCCLSAAQAQEGERLLRKRCQVL